MGEERFTLLVGKKPLVAYITAALASGEREVAVRARGRAISRAVAVAEALKRLGFAVESIAIGTEVRGSGEEARPVSTIEIVLRRQG